MLRACKVKLCLCLMTYTVSGGALNSAQPQPMSVLSAFTVFFNECVCCVL